MNDQDSSQQLRDLALSIPRIYAFGWLLGFVVTLLTTAISNGIWGVPVSQISDVNLSVILSVVILFLFLFAIVGALLLISGNVLPSLAVLAFCCIYALLPFSNICAFWLYAYWSGGAALSGSSFVYDDYMGIVSRVFDFLAAIVPAKQLLSNSPDLVRYVPQTGDMPGWISATCAVLSLIVTFRRTGRAVS